jgi:NADPH:quinone reductase-like Zn-dependent oxidoreductase
MIGERVEGGRDLFRELFQLGFLQLRLELLDVLSQDLGMHARERAERRVVGGVVGEERSLSRDGSEILGLFLRIRGLTAARHEGEQDQQQRSTHRYVVPMRAAVIHETGPPEVIRVEEAPDPSPGDGEVLVRVEAAGINRFDVNQRKGGASSFPLVLGSPGDAAGTRVDTGERVAVVSGKGTYAELTVAAEDNLYALPDSVETVTAAAVPTPYRTAWWGVIGRGELASGQTLLVQGGSSATGQAAIDIGRHIGASVFATGSESKHDRLRDLGAEPLAYGDPRVAELEADVVWEPLGVRTFERSVAALGRDGRVITPGAVGDPNVSFSVWGIVGKRGRIEGIAGQAAPREALESLFDLLGRGELRPWVERELPLDEAAEAHRLIEAGEVTGRVVLRP